MSDLDSLPLRATHRADVRVTLVLTDLMALRPLMATEGRAQLDKAITRLKQALSDLREADESLPEVTVHDPADASA